jgi:hypothetical protein
LSFENDPSSTMTLTATNTTHRVQAASCSCCGSSPPPLFAKPEPQTSLLSVYLAEEKAEAIQDTEEKIRLQTFRAVELEIEKAERRLASLRRQRNGLLPVSRLPPELLTIIFAHLRLAQHTEPAPGAGSPRRRDACYIAFTHVSHAWRTLALHTPSLWTRLDDRVLGTALAGLVLRRSSPVYPIALAARGSERALAQATALACSHQRRLRALELSNADVCAAPPLALDGLTYLPRLERLAILDANCAARLPTTMSAPRLRSLELQGTSFPWTDPSGGTFAHLTELTLAFLPFYSRLSVCELLSLLSRTPALERLYLHRVLPEIPHETAVTIEDWDDPAGEAAAAQASLPALAHFTHIEAHPEPYGAFLKRLVVPYHARCRYVLHGMWRAEMLAQVYPALDTHLAPHRRQGGPWTTAEIIIRDDWQVSVALRGDDSIPRAIPTWEDQAGSGPLLGVELPFLPRQGCHAQVAAALGSAAESVRTLSLFRQDESPHSGNSTRAILRVLGAVETFTTDLQSALTLDEEVDDEMGDATENNEAVARTEPPLLPKLKTLVIRNTPVGLCRDYVNEMSTENLIALRNILQKRHALGVPVQALHFNGFEDVSDLCGINKLRSSLTSLFVDGVQI